MYCVSVRLEVPEEHTAAFRSAIAVNAEASVRDEPGCRRFDVLQVVDSPTTFLFYELYDDAAAFDAHRVTPHYAVWREFVTAHLVPGTQANTLADLFVSHSDEVPA